MTPCATRSARPPTPGRGATSCATAWARSRCCARSARPARSAAGSSRRRPAGARKAQSPVRPVPARPADHARARAGGDENGVDVYDLDIREGLAEMLPGMQTPIYGYDGIYPGPTIRARKGRAAIVRARNGLTFDSNIHLHGGYVPGQAATATRWTSSPPAARSTTRTPTTRTPRRSGTTTTPTAAPRGRSTTGSSGCYVLDDGREEALELPRDEYDVPIVLADHAFNRDGSFRYAENVDVGLPRRHDPRQRRGGAAHARRAPALPPALRQRVELADLRPAARQRPPDGPDRQRRRAARAPAAPHARHAAPRRARRAARRLPRLPRRARRSCCRTPAASRRPAAVMRFDVDRGGGAEEARIPRGRMRTLERLPAPTASRRWDLALSTTSGVQWQLAGRGFDPSRVDVRPRLGTTELWQWRNPSNRSHPMHLHGMLFRVVERSTGVVPPRRARLEGHGRRRARARPSRCSRGSCPTRAATCSTATTSSTGTRR